MGFSKKVAPLGCIVVEQQFKVGVAEDATFLRCRGGLAGWTWE